MPAPYPTELKEAAVAAFQRGDGSAPEIAEMFKIGVRTLMTWCQQLRERGTLAPARRGGGNFSQVEVPRLLRVLSARQDATSDEITRAYNSGLSKKRKVHRSSILRALKREGFVFKKSGRGRPNKAVPMWSKSGGSSSAG